VNLGQSVFAQLLQFVPSRHFDYLVGQYVANYRSHTCSSWSQFVCMAYAQLTHRLGLRDVAACINSQHSKLYHCGLHQPISRSTLADANERRDWQLFEQLAQAKPQYPKSEAAICSTRMSLKQFAHSLNVAEQARIVDLFEQ
jgi:Domain of unknown function (DUF4372)